MAGKVGTIQSRGSSEIGETSGSGHILSPYPHDKNGAPGSAGPTNQPEQHLGVPTVTRGPDDFIYDTHTKLVEQTPVRDTSGEVGVQ